METTITFTGLKHYKIGSVKYWIYYYRRFKYLKGFVFRIFGVHIQRVESEQERIKKIKALLKPTI